MRWLVLVVMPGLAGCGRVGFDARGDATPAAADAHAADARAADAAACTFGAFGPPTRVAELATAADDWGPSLSPDTLTLVYASNVTGTYQLYTATRPSRTEPFGAPALLLVDGSQSQSDPYLSADGLTVWFDTFDATDQIWLATRPDLGSPFGSPFVDPGLAAGGDGLDPSLSTDQLTIVFDSGRAPNAGSGADIWLARRLTTDDDFVSPMRIDAIAQPGNDCCASLAEADHALYFAHADPAGGVLHLQRSGITGLDVAAPTALDPALDGNGEDTDPFLSTDGTTLIFASDRSGGAGDTDLYLATRTCE